MDCAAEEQLVRMRLDTVDGVDTVAVSLAEHTVTVGHDTDPEAIEEALRSLRLGTSRLDDGTTAGATTGTDHRSERRALLIALGINAPFLVVELTAGLIAKSMGLLADSLDMGADAAVYALSLAAVGRPVRRKKRLAATSGYVQLGVAAAGLAEVVRRFVTGSSVPDVTTMVVVSLLAFVGNAATLLILQRVRTGDAHIQASWIFTANDIKVNALVIVAAIGVAVTGRPAPDLIAGALIFLVVANGSRRILQLSR